MKIYSVSKKGLFSLLFFGICSSSIMGQQTATDLFKISSRSFQYKDYDNAIFFANKALEINPKYGAAYWNLALAYDYKNLLSKSVSCYSAAIALYDDDKDKAVLYKNRGVEYNLLQKYDSAFSDFNTAINLNDNLSYAWWNRAITLDAQKKYDLAINDYTHTIKLLDTGETMAHVFAQRGICYRNLGKKQSADSDFTKMIEIVGSEPGYYSAWAQYLLGNKEEAIKIINTYLAKNHGRTDDLKDIYFNAASIYAIVTEEKEALKFLEMAFKNGYNDFIYLERDKDFVKLKEKADFQSLTNKYKTK